MRDEAPKRLHLERPWETQQDQLLGELSPLEKDPNSADSASLKHIYPILVLLKETPFNLPDAPWANLFGGLLVSFLPGFLKHFASSKHPQDPVVAEFFFGTRPNVSVSV